MLDRRRWFRRRTLLGCRLSARRLGPIGEGTVRDLSEAGARVVIPRDAVLPQDFDIAVSDGAPQRARLLWYRDGTAGVAFTPHAVGGQSTSPEGVARPSTLLEARMAAVTARSSRQRR